MLPMPQMTQPGAERTENLAPRRSQTSWPVVERRLRVTAQNCEGSSNVRVGTGRPGPGLGPGPVGLEANLRGHGSTQFKKFNGLAGPMGTSGRPKIYFLIQYLVVVTNRIFSKICY